MAECALIAPPMAVVHGAIMAWRPEATALHIQRRLKLTALGREVPWYHPHALTPPQHRGTRLPIALDPPAN